MAKRYLTDEQMERIESLFAENEKQSILLKEILLCIKGSESMNIEGVIPAQKRMQREMHEQKEELQEYKEEIQRTINEKIQEVEDTQSEIKSTLLKINEWKNAMTIYVGLLTSRKLWSAFAVFLAIGVLIVLGTKYGFLAVWNYIKQLIF